MTPDSDQANLLPFLFEGVGETGRKMSGTKFLALVVPLAVCFFYSLTTAALPTAEKRGVGFHSSPPLVTQNWLMKCRARKEVLNNPGIYYTSVSKCSLSFRHMMRTQILSRGSCLDYSSKWGRSGDRDRLPLNFMDLKAIDLRAKLQIIFIIFKDFMASRFRVLGSLLLRFYPQTRSPTAHSREESALARKTMHKAVLNVFSAIYFVCASLPLSASAAGTASAPLVSEGAQLDPRNPTTPPAFVAGIISSVGGAAAVRAAVSPVGMRR